MTVPNTEPTRFRAGDTVRWYRRIPFYSALSGWSLKYSFSSAASKFDITAESKPNSDGYFVTITSESSAEFQPGEYTWVASVTNGSGERHSVGDGTCTILPDVAAATDGIDLRSQAQRSLSAIDAVLEGRAGADVEEYEIHGRRIRKMTVDELLRLRAYFAMKVQQERGGGLQKIRIGFGGRS